MSEIGRELSSLPLIQRCIMIGAGCTGLIAAVVTVINVIGEYPADHVVQAMLFGMVEAFVVGGIVGCILGLVVGILAYVMRSAIRSVAQRRS
jgi:hypothetical protein